MQQSAAGHLELGSGSASSGRSGAGVANGTCYRYIGDENLVPLEQADGGMSVFI